MRWDCRYERALCARDKGSELRKSTPSILTNVSRGSKTSKAPLNSNAKAKSGILLATDCRARRAPMCRAFVQGSLRMGLRASISRFSQLKGFPTIWRICQLSRRSLVIRASTHPTSVALSTSCLVMQLDRVYLFPAIKGMINHERRHNNTRQYLGVLCRFKIQTCAIAPVRTRLPSESSLTTSPTTPEKSSISFACELPHVQRARKPPRSTCLFVLIL